MSIRTIKGREKWRLQQIIKTSLGSDCADPQLDREIEVIAEGVGSFVVKKLRNLSKENITTITNSLEGNTAKVQKSPLKGKLLLQVILGA